MKLIKSIETKQFKLELFVTNDNLFLIQCERPGEEAHYSGGIPDYNLISYMFDLKAMEMEGN